CALHSPKNNALSIVVSSTVLPPGPRTTQPRAAIFQLTLVKLRLQRPTGELGNHLFTILATSQGDAPTCQHASTPLCIAAVKVCALIESSSPSTLTLALSDRSWRATCKQAACSPTSTAIMPSWPVSWATDSYRVSGR